MIFVLDHHQQKAGEPVKLIKEIGQEIKLHSPTHRINLEDVEKIREFGKRLREETERRRRETEAMMFNRSELDVSEDSFLRSLRKAPSRQSEKDLRNRQANFLSGVRINDTPRRQQIYSDDDLNLERHLLRNRRRKVKEDSYSFLQDENVPKSRSRLRRYENTESLKTEDLFNSDDERPHRWMARRLETSQSPKKKSPLKGRDDEIRPPPLSPTSSRSSSPTLLDSDEETREFCRRQRIMSLRQRQDQLLSWIKAHPLNRDRFLDELDGIESQLEQLEQSALSKISSPHRSALAESPEALASSPPHAVEEEQNRKSEPLYEGSQGTSSSLQEIPQDNETTEILNPTYDWSLYAKHYAKLLLSKCWDRIQKDKLDEEGHLIPSDVFEEIEQDIIQNSNNRLQVFHALNEVLSEKSMVAPNDVNAAGDYLIAQVAQRISSFDVIGNPELHDYIHRFTKALFIQVDNIRKPGLQLDEEYFEELEQGISSLRNTRWSYFDAVNQVLLELYPGLKTNFIANGNANLSEYLRSSRRPSSTTPDLLLEEVTSKWVCIPPNYRLGGHFTIEQCIDFGEDLAAQAVANEEEIWINMIT